MSSSAVASNDTSTFRPLDTTSMLRPARLLCPECCRAGIGDSVLEPCAAKEVEFHRCRACGGIWFHSKTVDQALDAACARPWPAPGQPRMEAKGPEVINDIQWRCPCCAGALVGVHDRRINGALVRRCLVCYGGWVEYSGLQNGSSGILSRVSRFISDMVS